MFSLKREHFFLSISVTHLEQALIEYLSFSTLADPAANSSQALSSGSLRSGESDGQENVRIQEVVISVNARSCRSPREIPNPMLGDWEDFLEEVTSTPSLERQ